MHFRKEDGDYISTTLTITLDGISGNFIKNGREIKIIPSLWDIINIPDILERMEVNINYEGTAYTRCAECGKGISIKITDNEIYPEKGAKLVGNNLVCERCYKAYYKDIMFRDEEEEDE